jgi:site-specific DNA-methyltransferase (adenine-specific)
MGSVYYPRDGQITYEHEYIVLFRQQGKWPQPSSEEAKERSRLTKEQRSRWFRGVWDDIAPIRQDGHVAMFPVDLPRRLIRMYTFWGETVLDPFLGSGTTSLAATLEGRDSVGYEINQEFGPIIRRKLGVERGTLLEASEIEVEFATRSQEPGTRSQENGQGSDRPSADGD